MKLLQILLNHLRSYPVVKYTFFLTSLIIIVVNILAILETDNGESWVVGLSNSLQIANFFFTLSIILIVAQYISNQYSQKTINLLISRGISRSRYISTLMISFVIVGYIYWFLLLLLALILSITIAIIKQNLNINEINITALFNSLILIPLKVLPLIAISFFLTVVYKSPILTTATMYLYIIMGEFLAIVWLLQYKMKTIADSLPKSVGDSLDYISINALQINEQIIQNSQQSNSIHTPFISILIIVIYLLIFTNLSSSIIKKQDLSA
jgi:ABC-type transport system involved in multi-copper enzyme maturation permease subunit